MNFASCITMHGKSLEAVRFYADVFDMEAKISLFSEHMDELGMPLPEGGGDLVYRAELSKKGEEGFRLVFVDSLALLFGGERGGNRDGLYVEVTHGEQAWVCDTFEKLMQGGGKANFAPRLTAGVPEASLIDRYGVCWILRGERQR